MSQPDPTRRWEGDERGVGSASASAFVSRLERLTEHARRPGWIAEEPEAHIWPRVERAIGAAGSPWRKATHSNDPDGRMVVDLEYRHPTGEARPARLRADVLALVGQFAEGCVFLEIGGREVAASAEASHAPATVVVDVLTGMLDGQTPFRSHGHNIRIRIQQS